MVILTLNPTAYMICNSKMPRNSRGSMPKHGYLSCLQGGDARKNVFSFYLIETINFVFKILNIEYLAVLYYDDQD